MAFFPVGVLHAQLIFISTSLGTTLEHARGIFFDRLQ